MIMIRIRNIVVWMLFLMKVQWTLQMEFSTGFLIYANDMIYLWCVSMLIIYHITDGLVDSVFYGIPDWVYEEEVLGVNYAHYING